MKHILLIEDDSGIAAYICSNLEKSNYNSNISFSTASETNNDYFTIERSGDGRSFESIGEIKGAGNSNQELSYEFVD